MGSVHVPAIYELHGHETVAEALSLAGGVSAVASTSSLEIERTDAQADGSSTRVAIDVAMNRTALAAPLKNADIVRVRASAAKFDKTVTLRGNVATPGRFAWHEGMHVRDLIPNKESLLTTDYWLRREQLGLPVADFQPMLPPVKVEAPNQPGQTINRPATPQDAQTVSSGLFPGLTAGVPTDKRAPERKRGAVSIARSFKRTDNGSKGEQAGKVEVTGEEHEMLGSGPHLVTTPHFPIETQVVRMSPDIDWSYAVVERVDQKTLTTRLLPFDLGAAVLNHEGANIALDPGDVITIFSDADIRVPRAQQTKYVRLEGEFAHSGVYSVIRERPLGNLLFAQAA